MKKQLLLMLFILGSLTVFAQVGIGTVALDGSAMLELNSTNRGFLMPRMTQVQMSAITSPEEGLMVYCMDCNLEGKGVYQYSGTVWTAFIIKTLIKDRNYADADHKFKYTTVVSLTGKTWLNNNLGANYSNSNHASFDPYKQATATTDANAYGSMYQWGRFSDGHEFRTSTVVTGTSSTPRVASPNTSSFLTGANNWYTGTNGTILWKADGTGVNNPCPIGYRLPSEVELNEERESWGPDEGSRNITTAWQSPLKFSAGGSRLSNGDIDGVGGYGKYAIASTDSRPNGLLVNINSQYKLTWKSIALSVRCIKN